MPDFDPLPTDYTNDTDSHDNHAQAHNDVNAAVNDVNESISKLVGLKPFSGNPFSRQLLLQPAGATGYASPGFTSDRLIVWPFFMHAKFDFNTLYFRSASTTVADVRVALYDHNGVKLVEIPPTPKGTTSATTYVTPAPVPPMTIDAGWHYGAFNVSGNGSMTTVVCPDMLFSNLRTSVNGTNSHQDAGNAYVYNQPFSNPLPENILEFTGSTVAVSLMSSHPWLMLEWIDE